MNSVYRHIILLGLVLSLLSLAVQHSWATEGWEGCPELARFFKETDPEHYTWVDLYRLFKDSLPDCDDGVYAEGYSDFIARSLANHWDRLEELATLASKDEEFKTFVLKHIGDATARSYVPLVLSNAQKRCPATCTQLCSEIAKAVLSALDFNK